MDAQEILLGSRVAHVRELKTEIDRLKGENAALHDEVESLKSHFDLALVAAQDLRALSPGAQMVLVDGWNLILGAQKEAADRADLIAKARHYLAAHPQDFVWIILDGPRPSTTAEGRLRITYTGGTGAHRADKFICDFLRMAKYLSLADRVVVRTNDKDFLSQARRIVS